MAGETLAYLASVMHASARHAELLARLEAIDAGEPVRVGPLHRGSGLANPTQGAALGCLSARADCLEQLEACERLVGEARCLCGHVRDGLSEMHGEVLERRFVDLAAWDRIADDLQVSPRTCQRYAESACEWCDGQGLERLIV